MRVIVQDRVYKALDQFYEASMENHPTLDLQTVLNKEDRLYTALQTLGENYYLYHEPRYILNWIRLGYSDFMVEDFHFAFHVVALPSGELVVSVEDVRHDLMFHD